MKTILQLPLILVSIGILATACTTKPESEPERTVKLVEKKQIRAIGVAIQTSFAEDRQAREVPPFFHKIWESKILDAIPGRLNQNHLCVFVMNPQSPDFTYFMGVEVDTNAAVPTGFIEMILPPQEYAAMEIQKRGNSDVKDGFGFLMENWIPKANYQAAPAPAFIYYDERFTRIFEADGYAGSPPATLFAPILPKP